MSESANNEAKIVISTDPAQFVKFMTDAARAFRDLEKEGKKSVGALDVSFQSLGKGMARFGADVARNVLGTALAPMQQAMAQALGNARTWRQESTRIMGATGEDWQKIGQQIDQMSAKTGRLPGDVANYADSIRELTGDWKTATEGAQDYSNIARYLGRQSVTEMAPLAATMDQMFGVKGQGNAQAFFDAAVRGAERLGQSGQQAIQGFERLSGQLGMQTAGGKRGQEFGKSAAALLPALRKQGLSEAQAESAVSQLSSYFTGDLQGLTRQFRSAGIIGKKETLTDEYGRLKQTLPQLLGMLNQLAVKHNKGLGGDDAMLQKLLMQNFSPLLAGAVKNAPQIQQDVMAALEAGAAGGPSPIGERAKKTEMTPEMKRQFGDLWLQKQARETKGETQLAIEDAIARKPDLGKEPNQSMGYVKQGGLFLSNVHPALGAGVMVAAGMSESVSEESAAGRSVTRQAKGLNVPEGSVEKGSFWSMFTSAQKTTARDTADAIGQKVLTVRMATPIPPISGGGAQVR